MQDIGPRGTTPVALNFFIIIVLFYLSIYLFIYLFILQFSSTCEETCESVWLHNASKSLQVRLEGALG